LFKEVQIYSKLHIMQYILKVSGIFYALPSISIQSK